MSEVDRRAHSQGDAPVMEKPGGLTVEDFLALAGVSKTLEAPATPPAASPRPEEAVVAPESQTPPRRSAFELVAQKRALVIIGVIALAATGILVRPMVSAAPGEAASMPSASAQHQPTQNPPQKQEPPKAAPAPISAKDFCAQGAVWDRDTLEGHTLSVVQGGAGYEEAIGADGRIARTGERVTFGGSYAPLSQQERDFYVALRLPYAISPFVVDATHRSKPGPDSPSWYANGAQPRLILAVNPDNGKSITAAAIEFGPAPFAGTGRGQNDPQQKPLWDSWGRVGDPPGYNGRDAGFPPAAIHALGYTQWMYGGPANGGEGTLLLFGWAPDQNDQPGPTHGVNEAAAQALLKNHALAEAPGNQLWCDTILKTDVSLQNVNTGPNPRIKEDQATGCSKGEQPGARELFNFVQYTWKISPNPDFGIWNCRYVLNTKKWSLHAEGRGLDFGLDAKDPEQSAKAEALFAWAIENAEDLGVQEVISKGRIWTPKYGLQKYDGDDQHTTHVHIGLNWDGAGGKMAAYASGVFNVR